MTAAYVIIKLITDNPWRMACIVLVIALGVLGLFTKFQSYKLEASQLREQGFKNHLQALTTVSKIQDAKIAATTEELSRVKKRQIETSKKLKAMFDNWPEDCGEATAQALKILRRGK